MTHTTISYKFYFVILIALFIALWLLNMSMGSVLIPLDETFSFFSGHSLENKTWQTILFEIRLPKSIAAILVGMGLSYSGLMMQTLFRNPMAGPSVLGISSGASLGVAVFIMGGSLFWNENLLSTYGGKAGLVFSAVLGSLSVLFVIMVLSIRLKNTLSILIIGLMLGALTASVVSILSYFSSATQLQRFMFWGFGNLGLLNYYELSMLAVVIFVGLLVSFPMIKSLNALLMGDSFAQSIGVPVPRIKNVMMWVTGVIVGVITSLVGPIAFVGLAVPHIAKLLFKTSDHKILLPASLLLGSSVLLLCDSIAQLPFSEKVIPINAVTSLIGAPIVIFLILKQSKYQF